MGENSGIKGFFGGLLSNAAWEWIKAAGGGLMSSLASALLAYVRNRPVDWWGVLLLGIITTVVVGLILLRENRQRLSIRESTSVNASELPITKDETKGILSPLQAKILLLSRDIRAFLREVGPAPELNNSDTNAWHVANGEWARKRLYGYKDQYLDRVKNIAHEIGATGLIVHPLSKYTDDVKPLIDFYALVDLLLEYVIQLEKPEDQRRREAERKMQERQALLADASWQSKMAQENGLVLTALQVKILRMAKSLTKFLRDLGPKPELPADQYDAIGGPEWIMRNMSLQEPWFQRLRGGFATGFASDLKSIYEELWSNGMQDYDLRIENNETVQAAQLNKAVDSLWKVAREIDEKA